MELIIKKFFEELDKSNLKVYVDSPEGRNVLEEGDLKFFSRTLYGKEEMFEERSGMKSSCGDDEIMERLNFRAVLLRGIEFEIEKFRDNLFDSRQFTSVKIEISKDTFEQVLQAIDGLKEGCG